MSGLRLTAIKNYKFIKRKQEYEISKEKLKDVPDDEKGLSENIEFIEKCEQKFFKLLQVLVKNQYAGLNFIDTYHRSGLYARELPCALGQEGAGVIDVVTPKAAEMGLKVGDRVAYNSFFS